MPDRRVFAFLVLFAAALPAPAANCTSAHGCADCKQQQGELAKCIPVSYDASCECSIDVRFPEFCILDGACDYSGQGSGGSGSGDPGGTVCYRLPSQWCPATCSSCETIFWV